MRYALLLHADTATAARTTPEEAAAELARYAALAQELSAAGVLVGGEALLPAHDGLVVQVENGHRSTDAGRSGERELSGFLLVECDLDRAVEIAGRLPVAAHGAVEVRPVLDLGAPVT